MTVTRRASLSDERAVRRFARLKASRDVVLAVLVAGASSTALAQRRGGFGGGRFARPPIAPNSPELFKYPVAYLCRAGRVADVRRSGSW